MENRELIREVANWANLSTIGGIGLAVVTRCNLQRGIRGIYYARNYVPSLPKAGAFTVGNVVFFRPALSGRTLSPALLSHEETHSTQYALCLGLPFLVLYFVAAGYSWLRTGDPASQNIFERTANLRAGGYQEQRVRKLLPVLMARLRHFSARGSLTAGGESL